MAPDPPVPPEPGALAGPPDDPEEWSDEQWLAWLQQTDDADHPDDVDSQVAARKRSRRGGGVLGVAMLGLRNAIYGELRDEIVIVQDASGDPPDDDDRPVVRLDREHPELSEVVVRRRRRRPPRP